MSSSAVEEGSERVLELGVVKAHDEGEVDHDRIFLRGVDDSGRVVAFPVVGAGHSGS